MKDDFLTASNKEIGDIFTVNGMFYYLCGKTLFWTKDFVTVAGKYEGDLNVCFYVEGKNIFVGLKRDSDSSPSTTTVYTSTDAKNWTQLTTVSSSDVSPFAYGRGANYYQDFLSYNNKYYAVADNSGSLDRKIRIYVSDDLVNWTVTEITTGSGNNIGKMLSHVVAKDNYIGFCYYYHISSSNEGYRWYVYNMTTETGARVTLTSSNYASAYYILNDDLYYTTSETLIRADFLTYETKETEYLTSSITPYSSGIQYHCFASGNNFYQCVERSGKGFDIYTLTNHQKAEVFTYQDSNVFLKGATGENIFYIFPVPAVTNRYFLVYKVPNMLPIIENAYIKIK